MIIDASKFHEVYEKIQLAHLNHGTILIFVTPNVDSLCSCRILTSILKCDNIPYKIVPVSDYEHLHSAFQTHILNNDEHQCIFLLNCGATVDLPEDVFLYEDEGLSKDQKVYVIDSHRPYNLSNVYHPNIFIIDDGDFEEVPLDEFTYDEINQYDPEEEMELDEEVAYRKKLVIERIDKYYRHSYMSTPTSKILYELSTKLNKKDNQHLWLAIIGLTNQFVFEWISKRKYDEFIDFYTKDVRSRNARNASTITLDDGFIIPISEDERIVCEKEFRLMLYRHWSIFESMFHSPYVASRLGIWKERGRERMNLLFATLGVPLEECKQNYENMKLDAKNAFRTKMEQYGKYHKLDEFFYQSFYKHHGIKFKVSAADMVYCVTALLERPVSNTTWENNFWIAYDALAGKNNVKTVEIIQEGIKCAIELQKEMLNQVLSILERKIVTTTEHYRLVRLTNTKNVDFFLSSSALIKLAIFLRHVIHTRYPQKKKLIVCAENVGQQTHLMVGLPTGLKNIFGYAFKQTYTRFEDARVRHSGFENYVIEVQSDDMAHFLETLAYLLPKFE